MRLTTLLTLAPLLVPSTLAAQDTPEIPVPNPSSKVESIRGECERRYEGQSLGSIEPSAYCKVVAWSELGQHYPALLRAARTLQERHNERTGKLNEARQQLRRERQQTDRMARRIGKLESTVERQVPKWVPYVASAGALFAGGAIGYGVGSL